MGKFVPDSAIDAMLGVVANAVDRIDICTTQPTNYTEATSTYSLGNTTLTAGVGNGDWTVGNGEDSGRKLTMGQQTGVAVTGDGLIAHLAGTDGSSTLWFVTTCTNQEVYTGNTATVNAFDIEISDVS